MTEKQATIFIVDDEDGIRRLLKEKLSNQGYYCQEAGTADQALERLGSSSGPVDLSALNDGDPMVQRQRVRW